ncbi:hypothetical protein A8146_26225 [Mesorhizobium loti]|nr:hypothetical protein A8146_26225 [Mesorhizobium loti]
MTSAIEVSEVWAEKVVIRGASTFGGYTGTIIGALILTVLTTLLTILQMPEGAVTDIVRADRAVRDGGLSADCRGAVGDALG